MTRALMTKLLLPAAVLCLAGCISARPVEKTAQRESPTLRDLAWAFSDLEGAAARAAAGAGAESAPSARLESPYGYRTSQAGRETRNVIGALPALPSPFEQKNELYKPETASGRKPELKYNPASVAVPARPEMKDVEELLSREAKSAAASTDDETKAATPAPAAETPAATSAETPAEKPADEAKAAKDADGEKAAEKPAE